MTTPNKPVPWYIPIALLTLGVLSALLGAWLAWSSWTFLFTSKRVEGTVTDLVEVKSNTDSPGTLRERSFAPAFEYQAEGRAYRIQSKVSSSAPSYSVGDKVPVRYPPDRPGEGRIDSISDNWVLPLVFGGGGLVFLAVGLGMAVARRRVARATPD
jgi:hypothetical protein